MANAEDPHDKRRSSGQGAPEQNAHELSLPQEGTLIGDKYRVGSTLARGGMGRLVRARHELLEHEVAIKFVLDRDNASARTRLLREARAMRALTSEHVVDVLDLGMVGDAPFIVMELLEGRDLRHVVEDDGPMAPADAVDTILEATVAVAEAHTMGIVHRDLKPANLFLARIRQRELVKVLDFGISKVPEPDRDDPHATTEDTLLGTPHFASPEQLRNPTRVDARTDVWSLGVTLFYLLTGELPFDGDTRREVMAAIFADEPKRLSSHLEDAPLGLEEVIEETLRKRPEDRTADVITLARALVPFGTGRAEAALDRAVAASVATVKDLAAEPTSVRTTDITTEAGLSSTLISKDTHDVTEATPPDREPRAGRPHPGWLAAGVAAVAGVWVWTSSPEPKSAPPAPQHAAATSTETAPAANTAITGSPDTPDSSRTAPPPIEDTSASTSASEPSPPDPQPAARAPKPPGADPNGRKAPTQPSDSHPNTENRSGASANPAGTAAPAAKSATSTASAAPATSATVPRDIDGFPILR